jgi:hypothetical protein
MLNNNLIELCAPGIYEITCLKTNKCYIGESINCFSRLGRHIDALENNRQDCGELQMDFNCYGKKNFSLKVLKTGSYYKKIFNRKKIENAILLTRNKNFIYNDLSKPSWPKYSQPIQVNGEIYQSLRFAALSLNESKTNLIRKCRDKTNFNYQYLDKTINKRSSRSVQINGVYYASIKAARLELKLAFSTIKKKCQSEQYPTYIYV